MSSLCWVLAACGGGDSKETDQSNNGGTGGSGAFGPNDPNQLNSNEHEDEEQNTNQQQSSTQSECSSSSDCEMVVCDCPDGPVNYTGCSVVNGVGKCATESTCESSFGACD